MTTQATTLSIKPKTYRLLKDRTIRDSRWPAGTLVYELLYYDYGLANDDTRATGIEHKSVTLDPEGNYPSFTVPVGDLLKVG